MELIRGLNGLRSRHRPCVATIGAFDGVHRGHLTVLDQLRAQSREYALPATVITFEPLPREYLQPDEAPPRLTSLREKVAVMTAAGVDQLLCLTFDERLRSMDAEAFVEEVLLEGLAVRALILGDDFRFGRGRGGGREMVERIGQREGFITLPTDTFELDGERVSSTRVRAALSDGDFTLAAELLGRPYTLGGRVVHGRRLGRQLGTPTANINLSQRPPLAGVFAVTVSGAGLEDVPAVANLGTRPTVEADGRRNLEVHLLDRSEDLYGQRLSVRFRQKLREEQRFDSLEALKRQIAADRDNARQWFAAQGSN